MDTNLIDDEIDFQKYLLVLKRQWKPALVTFLIITAGALAFALSRKPMYEAESKLLFKSDRSTSLTGLGEALGRIEPLTFQANPLDTQVEIIRSTPILAAVIQDLNLTDDSGLLLKPDDFAQSLTVRAIPGTDVLSIAYKSNDPETAASVSNKVAEVFIGESIQDNRAEAIAAREFLSQQLPRTEDAVNQAEVNLQQFKERNQVVALDQEASSLVNISFELQRQIDAARSQIASIDSTLTTYQNRLNIQSPQLAIVLAALNQSEGVQQALTELQDIEGEIATSSALFTPDSQAISRLVAKRDNLQEVLGQRIEQVVNDRPFSSDSNLQLGDLQTNLIGEVVALDAQRQGLVNQIFTLSTQMSEYGSRMSTMPGLEKQLSELERELMVAQTTYQTLLSRFQELQVAESQSIGNVRLISPAAIPEESVGNYKKLIIAVSIFVGILAGIALAFFLDLVDSSVKTVKEAKDLLGYKTLGIIPKINGSEEAILYSNKERRIPSVITRDLYHSQISESYRLLKANLSFLNPDKLIKTIVVTSILPNEGKSEVVANLAAVIAQGGQRVLLVDADMRSPMQHHIWNIDNLVGLSNMIVEQRSMQEAVQEVMPNLDVLMAGVIPPNPLTLLGSSHMEDLIAKVAEQYDFVIFDTPPLFGTADSSILSKMSDGIVLVVRPGVVDVSKAEAAKEFLNQSAQRVLGMVINGVDVRGEPDSHFYASRGTTAEFNGLAKAEAVTSFRSGS